MSERDPRAQQAQILKAFAADRARRNRGRTFTHESALIENRLIGALECGADALRALSLVQELEAVAREFVDYWTGATEANFRRSGAMGTNAKRSCGMCGGVPHSTTCFVGRMQVVLSSPVPAPQREDEQAPLEAPHAD